SLRFLTRGASPPGLSYALSLAASPARYRFLTEGLRPSDSPTRALAHRFAGSRRARGSHRCARSLAPVRRFASRTPLHALSLAASPPRAVRVARIAALARSRLSGASPPGLPPGELQSPSAARVFASTTPSAIRPRAAWNAI